MSNKATIASVRKGLTDANSCSKDDTKVIAEIVVQLNKFYSGKRPLFVFCNKTGKKCAMTAKAYFAKKLAEYGGSIEKLFFTYSGRQSAKTTRAPKINKPVAKTSKVAVSNGPSMTVCNWVHKLGKKDNTDIIRTEIKIGKKVIVLKEFNEATQETSYLKGNEKTVINL